MISTKKGSGIRRSACITLGLLLAGPAHAAGKAEITQGTLIDHVTIVDTRNGALTRDMAIAISDGKIVQIARSGSLKAGGAARSIDARGKYVVPGYLDMHAHNLNSDGPDKSLPLMVANGVTGFRQMAGAPPLLAARKAGKLIPPVVAPELLAMPGMVLVGPPTIPPAAMVAEVDKQKEQGADFIKVVDLPPAAFLAALEESKRLGLPFAGHFPDTMDVHDAARLGMKSVEHLGPSDSLLLSCSSNEKALREGIAAHPAPPPKIDFTLPPAALKRLTANPMMLGAPQTFALIRQVIDSFDEAKCRAFAKDMAASELWQVPTLIRLRAMELGNDSYFRDDPNLKYIDPVNRQMWLDVGAEFPKKLTQDQMKTLADLFPLQLKLIKLFDDAGVKMLVGTDFGGQWLVSGFSIHQEFDLMEKAGISPLHVLQMTTLNGAKFLNREATMGTVETGKDANLVLLDANPIASVQNLHRIDAVVRGGTYYSRAALDDLKKAALPQ